MYDKEEWKKQKDLQVLMQDFKEERNFINIGLTVARNESLVKSLIPLHAISGCDTVPSMFNIGKVKCINVAKKYPLQHIGKVDANIEDVLNEGKRFVAKCYGLEETDSSKNRLVSFNFSFDMFGFYFLKFELNSQDNFSLSFRSLVPYNSFRCPIRYQFSF